MISSTTSGLLALLNNATFDKQLAFSYSWIGQNFEANDSKFGEIYFMNSIVLKHVLMNRAKFNGNANFSFLETGSNFEAYDAEFNGPVYFNDMTIRKSFIVDRATFGDELQIVRTSSNMLSAMDTSFLDQEDKIDVYALDYGTLHIKDSETGEGLLSLLDKSAFNGNDYKKLQEYYIKLGYPIAAEQVYFQYKLREATKSLYPWHWRWWWSWFLLFFIAYGNGPDRKSVV